MSVQNLLFLWAIIWKTRRAENKDFPAFPWQQCEDTYAAPGVDHDWAKQEERVVVKVHSLVLACKI